MKRHNWAERVVFGLVVSLLTPLGLTPVWAQPPAGEVVYYHTDAVGSVRMVTDEGGAAIEQYNYTPFGKVLGGQAPGVAQPRGYAGKERDVETGFDYFGGRYLYSEASRFTTPDPVLDAESAMADPQRWNRYCYVRNNPLRYTDPDGRDTLDLAIGFAVGIGRTAGNMVYAPVALATDFRGTMSGAASAMATDFRLLKYGLANPSEVWETYSRLATSANDADQRALGEIFGGATLTTALIVAPAAEAAAPTARILSGAAKGTGNFGIRGSATAAEAMEAGKTWVGKGYRVASDGKTLVSQDGLRQFRPASFKPKLGKEQANFEQRSVAQGKWTSNGHLDIKPR